MKKVLMIILDGFGYREEKDNNALASANMVNFNRFWEEYPHSLLIASGEEVGLKQNQVGNCDVGHSTIGAGRILKPNEILVDDFFKNVDYENESVISLLEEKEKNVHIMGLCSDGNIHAGIDDFLNMFKFLVDNGFKKIHFHLITDGKDTESKVALTYINMINEKIKEYVAGDIATICGRYYAMDKDKNWDRTKVYYNLVTYGDGANALSIERAVNACYNKGLTDDLISPIVLSKNTIKNDDVLIWMNYRSDASKQILSAISINNFDEFRVKDLSKLKLYSFFPIDKKIKTNNFLIPTDESHTLGVYLGELGLTQARIAEEEKFNFVTEVFDCGYNGKIDKCDKFKIAANDIKDVTEKPEMSAVGITKKIINCMENDYDFIVANFTNGDTVGHTSNNEATIKACMAIDVCLGKIFEKAEDNFYKVILVGDHGHVEDLKSSDDLTGVNTFAKVPFVIGDSKINLEKEGNLANVAPTILEYMDIALPKEMTSDSLIIIDE